MKNNSEERAEEFLSCLGNGKTIYQYEEENNLIDEDLEITEKEIVEKILKSFVGEDGIGCGCSKCLKEFANECFEAGKQNTKKEEEKEFLEKIEELKSKNREGKSWDELSERQRGIENGLEYMEEEIQKEVIKK